ncbi:MAG: sulfate transporter CysZ [Gammaproteobacteria bacterium]|nr:sulfate transporter CysZ [Gammaproteobacteria bacterium]
MRNNPVTGAGYFLRGIKLAFVPGVRAYVVVPLLVNVVLFSVLIYVGVGQFRQLLDWLLPEWLDWLTYVLLPLFVVLALIITFFAFSVIGNLIAAPFNGLLAEAVETHLRGEPMPSGGWRQLVVDLGRTMLGELRKLGYIVLWAIPLLVLFLVPVLNLVAPFLWLVFSAWMLAISFVDYPMGNHGHDFSEQRRILRGQRYLALGFGGATMLALAIPVLNFIVIPAAVAGATALWVEQLAPPAARAQALEEGKK